MLYWPINATHAKVISLGRSDYMLIKKISIVRETQVFEYVKNSDTGFRCGYVMRLNEEGKQSLYDAWKDLETIIHHHYKDSMGVSAFSRVRVLLRQLELKYMVSTVEGKEIRIPSHVRFNGIGILEEKSFKFTTEWIVIEDHELESVQTMIREAVDYINGRRAQEQLFEDVQ